MNRIYRAAYISFELMEKSNALQNPLRAYTLYSYRYEQT